MNAGSASCSVSLLRCSVFTMFFRRAVIAVGGSAAALFSSVAVGKQANDPGLPWTPLPTGSWDSNWDRRAPTSLINLSKLKGYTEKELNNQLQEQTAVADRHIFLIRHGEYHHNKAKKLTCRGREQAELTGERLKSLGLNFNSIVHSSLTRATETAEIISQHLTGVKMSSTELLNEGPPIQPVPDSTWRPKVSYYAEGPRIEAAFRKFIHRAKPEQTEDSYEIIVCHDNVIRYFACRALQLLPDAWLRFQLYHGSISKVVVYANGNVSVQMLGDAGYMPSDKLTGL